MRAEGRKEEWILEKRNEGRLGLYSVALKEGRLGLDGGGWKAGRKNG